MTHPKKATIARSLGITAAAFTKYVRRGCPVYSVEAALAWQKKNIDPAQRLAQQRRVVWQETGPSKRYTIGEIIAECLQAGEAAGMRYAFDWIYRTPEAVAATLIRHGGLAPDDASRLATIAGIGLHAIALKLHQLEDEELDKTFHGFWKGNVEQVRARLPDGDKLPKRALELSRELWPMAND